MENTNPNDQTMDLQEQLRIAEGLISVLVDQRNEQANRAADLTVKLGMARMEADELKVKLMELSKE